MLKKILLISALSIQVITQITGSEYIAQFKHRSACPTVLDTVIPLKDIQALILGYLDSWEIGHKEFTGHKNYVHVIAFSPCGTYVATGSEDKTIKIWNFATAICLHTIQTGDTMQALTYSPCGNYLTSGSWEKKIKIWNTFTGECTKILEGHTHAVSSIAYSLCGNYLASGSYDKTVKIWDLKTYQERILGEHTRMIESVDYSPCGEYLATGTGENITLWSTKNSSRVKTFSKNCLAARFSPCGKYLAAITFYSLTKGYALIKLIDIKTQESKDLAGHTSTIGTISYSPCGKYLVSISHDKKIIIWDTRHAKLHQKIDQPVSHVHGITFSRCGNYIAFGAQNNSLMILKNQARDIMRNSEVIGTKLS